MAHCATGGSAGTLQPGTGDAEAAIEASPNSGSKPAAGVYAPYVPLAPSLKAQPMRTQQAECHHCPQLYRGGTAGQQLRKQPHCSAGPGHCREQTESMFLDKPGSAIGGIVIERCPPLAGGVPLLSRLSLTGLSKTSPSGHGGVSEYLRRHSSEGIRKASPASKVPVVLSGAQVALGAATPCWTIFPTRRKPVPYSWPSQPLLRLSGGVMQIRSVAQADATSSGHALVASHSTLPCLRAGQGGK
jgi:hypothetical protein